MPQAAVVAFIEDDQRRLLALKRSFDPYAGMLDLPGGFVDPGETLETALLRETREEVGLEVTEAEYLFSAPNPYAYGGMMYTTTDAAFRCQVADLSMASADDETESIPLAKSKRDRH